MINNMAFGFDDIAVGLAEVSDVKSEAGLESVELLGDGLGEVELRDRIELNKIETGSENTIIGDGLGEEELINEKAIDVGEASDLSVAESTEIDGDSVGESSVDNPLHFDEQRKTGAESIELEQAEVDDNGKPYIKDGELLPNNTYEINGVKYETDDKGRIIHAETNVEINNSPRPSLNNRKVDGLEPGDDKGHIVAHILGGADSEGNLVAMDSKLNRGEYKSMELKAKRALEEGKEVKMTVDIEYDENSKRPKSFTVTLEIDDEITVIKFLNNKNE